MCSFFWSNLELWPRLCSSVGLAEEGVWSCEYKSSIPLKTAITYSFCHFQGINKNQVNLVSLTNKPKITILFLCSHRHPQYLSSFKDWLEYPTILSPKEVFFAIFFTNFETVVNCRHFLTVAIGQLELGSLKGAKLLKSGVLDCNNEKGGYQIQNFFAWLIYTKILLVVRPKIWKMLRKIS